MYLLCCVLENRCVTIEQGVKMEKKNEAMFPFCEIQSSSNDNKKKKSPIPCW